MLDAPALGGTPTPALRPPAIVPSGGVFRAALAAAAAPVSETEEHRRAAVLERVVKLLILLEMLGLPLPTSMIQELKAAGLEAFAKDQELRNRELAERSRRAS